ncbi:putative permease [Salinivirga cyanobacteriivorans]|uniref:Putative permease n=1 Tax=Salinivirga cyanobacteriivorans TaxID=1307839 RepID=A0A0S2I1K4_9BACT|nr:permease [Salinivirga cyanobacteriivorans]ALO16193.1 putative permease [Salinivirga cyanobacteriivorans]
MENKKEFKILSWIIIIFLFAYFMPLESARFTGALMAMFDLAKWYAQEHVILCLLPAFFIAGVIAVFVSQGAVMKYFGANAKKWLSYSVASVSGTILAVCSCTILPLFSSIHKRGAGLGPAVAFLYSGPAINILAIILTARILGIEMGIARIIGAVVFAIVIGSVMSIIYRKEEKEKREEQMNFPNMPEKRPLWQTSLHFFTLVLILVFANWGKPADGVTDGAWFWIWSHKWHITGFFGIVLIYSLIRVLKINWIHVAIAALATLASGLIFSSPLLPMVVGIAGLSIITLIDKKDEDNREWTMASWDFAKQILPLLAIGVLIAGFLLGSTHGDTAMAGVIPESWIAGLVGGNSVLSNFFASIVGAFMYFATLTEVPILQGLMAAGMGKGPALALLLAGPSLSLPNMLVIRGVMGTQKTIVYVVLVVIMATISGLLYGFLF